ncbi:MAG: RagB/SusD family nutrient uptake outer membrane protein [Muribaculaceae bacterium]|nr:RagB/SusD family nutrient uptake outer membrane protein [Muribaculaceae bacterium]MDE6753781.1 RagB/SusD family nutrient uptake outer membrane protein [Muribaculaceae bacterium]
MNTFNKIINTAFLAATSLVCGMGFVSCDDMLDTKPQGQFTDVQIGDKEAIDLMTAAYATLLNHYFGNNESFAGPINNWVFDIRSDDAQKGGGELGYEVYMHEFSIGNVQSDNPILDFKWRNDFFSISRCNTAIRAIQSSGSLSDDVKKAYVAEMKTLRAYYYFDLYRIFKKFPYFDENVANPSGVSASEYTREQIARFIVNDLEESYNNNVASQSDPGRFNKYVAAAVLARVALFLNDYPTAEKYADYVIASNQYSLYPNFLDISKPEMNNQYESVMAVQFSSANSPDQYNFNNCLNCTVSEGNLYGNGDDFYTGSQNLVNAFRTDANGLPYLDEADAPAENLDHADYAGNVDPRVDFTFGRIGMPWRGYQYNENWCRNLNNYSQFSGKKPYPSPDSPYVQVGIVPWGASSLNYIIVRYADVMLMKAEALIEQNKDLDEARNLINLVRAKAARSVDPNYTPVDINPMVANYAVGQYSATAWNQDYARKAVRMERRLELAMEGLRWFDLVRWGIATEVVNKYYQTEASLYEYLNNAHLNEADIYCPIPLNQVDNAGDLYK